MNTNKFFNNNETAETGANFTGHGSKEFTGNEFDNFDNNEFKNNEFENSEFTGGEFAEDEFNNSEFNGNEFVEEEFSNNEFGEQENKFERKNNMSNNFGSKFAAVILAILTLAAPNYYAASNSHNQYEGYNYNPAAEARYDGDYQNLANNNPVDVVNSDNGVYDNYANANKAKNYVYNKLYNKPNVTVSKLNDYGLNHSEIENNNYSYYHGQVHKDNYINLRSSYKETYTSYRSLNEVAAYGNDLYAYDIHEEHYV